MAEPAPFFTGFRAVPVPAAKQASLQDPVYSPIPIHQAFDGLGNLNFSPNPDTEGDVGPGHYFQMLKYSFAIWDKEGNLLYGPADNKTLWEDLPGHWNTLNYYTDPIVLYDPLNNRWLVTCMVYDIPDVYYEMIAVSQSPDPLGSWNLYAYVFANMPDYPKFGVWPDGYYMTVNECSVDAGYNATWEGLTVMVFNRDDLCNGVALPRTVKFDLEPTGSLLYEDPSSFLPCDMDGPAPPPGTPNYLASIRSTSMGFPNDHLLLWRCMIDWNDTALCTLTEETVIPVSPFIHHLDDPNRITQPEGGSLLFTINDRLMMRLQYRNFGSYQTLVTSHSVDIDGTDHYGVRWYELRNGGTGWMLHQEGTHFPDQDSRWMGSLAMDGNGNIGAGYSVSGPSTFPSVRITGRRATDEPGIMTFEETEVSTGEGSQMINQRWGDYSMMSVDPADDLTFWYTQQYNLSTGSANWQTRICAFRIDSVLTGNKVMPATQTEIFCYPNPAKEGINVVIPGNLTCSGIELCNAGGVTTGYFPVPAGQQMVYLEVGTFIKGLYFLKIHLHDHPPLTKKILIQ